MYQKKLQDSVDPYTTYSIDLDEAKNVSFECVWCVKRKCQRKNRCVELWNPEDYLWETRYFQKYSNESVWGKWKQEQLGVKVVYGS